MEKSRNHRDIGDSANPPAGGRQTVSAGSGRTAIRLDLEDQGRDLLLLVTGGEAHVGAVAVAHDEGLELVVVPGHKEGPLARDCARAVARASGRTCAAVAGIHQDEATGQEIVTIVANVHQALKELIQLCFPEDEDHRESHEQP